MQVFSTYPISVAFPISDDGKHVVEIAGMNQHEIVTTEKIPFMTLVSHAEWDAIQERYVKTGNCAHLFSGANPLIYTAKNPEEALKKAQDTPNVIPPEEEDLALVKESAPKKGRMR